jgi:hypothetical protein
MRIAPALAAVAFLRAQAKRSEPGTRRRVVSARVAAPGSTVEDKTN